jgi:hypothetical protein
MKRFTPTCFCLLVILAGISAGAGEPEPFDLSPHLKPGQRWSGASQAMLHILTTDGPAGTFSSPGETQNTQKYAVRVVEVNGGKWTKLDIDYDKCEIKTQQAGAPAAQVESSPLSRKQLTIARPIDATAHGQPQNPEDAMQIDEHGAALPVEVEDDLRANFAWDFMPTEPVRIGQTWKSDKVGVIFGANSQGKLELKLDRIETANSQRRAVVTVTGSTTQQFGAKVHGDKREHEIVVDMTIDYDVHGAVYVDLATGLIDQLDLDGPVTIEHGAAMGHSLRQHGKFHAQLRCTPLEADPTVAPAAGAAHPDAAPNNTTDFSGLYRDDLMSIKLTSQQGRYTGVITIGPKQFPLQGKADGADLTGTFDSDGTSFTFRASLDGSTLKLITANKTYILKRAEQARNPLGADAP